MGRVSEKHLRFRTKEQMVKDVVFILTAPVSYAAKWAVLKSVYWQWTEFHGKYDGCPHWSRLAHMFIEANPTTVRSKRLRHEHAVPRDTLNKLLFDLSSPTYEVVNDLLSRLLIGVVVMKEEAALLDVEYRSKMPSTFYDKAHADYLNPWLRYRLREIALHASANNVEADKQSSA